MTRLRWILVGIGAFALACLRFFFVGRTRGRAEGAMDVGMQHAEDDADRIRDLATAGDDAGVQRELAQASARADAVTSAGPAGDRRRRRTGPKKG